MTPLFDSHCHINTEEFDTDRAEVVARMKAEGLVGAMVIGCGETVGELDLIRKLVDANSGFLYGAWALHPEYEDVPEVSVDEIVEIDSDPRIYAVGETGLDYHWCHGDLTWQKERFRRHIEAAKILGKPLIVHAREAESDALRILVENRANDVGFVLHCYNGDIDTAKRCVDAGGMISVTGVLTFKNAQSLRDVVKTVPIEHLMIETDCPYMSPIPMRGKRNEPSYVKYVNQTMARIKEISVEECANKTTENAYKFFGLKK